MVTILAIGKVYDGSPSFDEELCIMLERDYICVIFHNDIKQV